MKYIRIDLLNSIAHWGEIEEKLWQDAILEYEKYLKSIRHRFPRPFYEFITQKTLHDFSLISFDLTKRKNHVIFETVWAGFGQECKIVFNNVTQVETNLCIPSYKNPDISEYLYGEFISLDRHQLEFNCILTDDGYMRIVFQNMRFSIN